MAKVLFALSGDIYVRNYVQSGVLKALSALHDISVIANADLELRDEVSALPNFLGFYNFAPEDKARYDFAFRLLMWRYRKKSKTFMYRWVRNSRFAEVLGSRNPLATLVAFVAWLLSSLRNPKWIVLPVLASRGLFPTVFHYALKNMTTNSTLEKFVTAEDWDLVVFPSAAFDPMSVEMSRLGSVHRIKTLCLIDNWDNLTSKTVFWHKPDHLGVWGEQSKKQAVEIHEFSEQRVHIVGTPRFDDYFRLRATSQQSIYPFRYILFVGSAMPFDEITALKELESCLSDLGPNFADIKIVYRPHPWQQKRNSPADFEPDAFSLTVLDTQFRTGGSRYVYEAGNREAFQPNLSYYPALLSRAEAVVGPLTTMLLEASLCLRPVVALSYADGVHYSPRDGYFVHFEGVDMIPGFRVCRNRPDLCSEIKQALLAEAISSTESDAVTRFFLEQPKLGYSNGVSSLIERIIRDD
jgi:hypothetical protein